jgi:hypothetical protein
MNRDDREKMSARRCNLNIAHLNPRYGL